MDTISIELKKRLMTCMLRIRRVEERIDAEYLQDQMRTPIHLCIGQEAIAAGVCAALNDDDTISSNHRSHGHYLAKGGDLGAFIAELHCRSTGCSGGFGGSMHIIDTAIGHLGSSSIVGGGIPIGTGHALAFALRKEKRVSVVFLGDGAAEEGVLYESINFAVLKRLPVIYVLENNKIALCSPFESRQPCQSIFHNAYASEMLATSCINGNDVEEVYKTAANAVSRARNGLGPSFIEADTFRILGHMGCAAQDVEGYRNLAEVDEWRKKCPINSYLKQLTNEQILTDNEYTVMDTAIKVEIQDAFLFAQQSPFSDPSEAARTVFCE